MEDIKWCPQHGYPLPCDKCGMPSKTLKELIDERILDLEITAGDHLFSDLHRLITKVKIEELEWVRRNDER